MTKDNARSINDAHIQHFAPDCFRATEAGVYNISIVIDNGTSASTNTQCIIRRVSDNSLIFGGAKAAGAWEFNVSSPVYLQANEEFRFRYYHEAGGGQTWHARVRITKTSAMSAPASLPGTSHALTGDLTVGGTTYVNKIDNKSHWTASFTTSSIPSGSLWGPGQPASTTGTTDTGLVSWAANDTLKFRDAGIYAVSMQVRMSSVSNGSGAQSFISLEPTVNVATNPAYSKDVMPYSDNQMGTSIPNLKVTAGMEMKMFIAHHASGGVSSTGYWRINVTRIG
jgi:hypothetical protein